MAAIAEMVEIGCRIRREQCTLVSLLREAVTTERGLDVVTNFDNVKSAVSSLKGAGIIVSLFVDPNERQIRASKETGADAIEIHTGRYAEAEDERTRSEELESIRAAVQLGNSMGFTVHAGHGLNYVNIFPVLSIPGIEEFNIGHSIISRAVFTGLDRAVREMVELIRGT